MWTHTTQSQASALKRQNQNHLESLLACIYDETYCTARRGQPVYPSSEYCLTSTIIRDLCARRPVRAQPYARHPHFSKILTSQVVTFLCKALPVGTPPLHTWVRDKVPQQLPETDTQMGSWSAGIKAGVRDPNIMYQRLRSWKFYKGNH